VSPAEFFDNLSRIGGVTLSLSKGLAEREPTGKIPPARLPRHAVGVPWGATCRGSESRKILCEWPEEMIFG